MKSEMEECVAFCSKKHCKVGMRYTPLHHRQMAECYRLSTDNRPALMDAMKIAKRDGWRAAGPYLKLDGVRYIEIFA